MPLRFFDCPRNRLGTNDDHMSAPSRQHSLSEDRRVSMSDVARLAGVSAQTVSRVSNGSPGVIEATRQQVIAAMNELGYRLNSAARA
jgi:transcriptional regulator with XRE-family HTH domain